nr:MAG TPA: hypothetical protein [Caudoviricetes sp.]
MHALHIYMIPSSAFTCQHLFYIFLLVIFTFLY